ncbi:Imm1 family immunity protein [Actinokineospora soli]|uniref:Imm1 family immunity protein n=1 Tax=Actinokineospora soli TaxID=1048753 RepID=A0ABW2THT1_9PSEU
MRPLNVLRSLLQEFMQSGERPTCVGWRRTAIF